ncbi:hypothetical protein GCM10010388_61180 [Streptomyces mauvecolor]
MVTKGPIPHIWLMLMAVAWKSPIRRTKPPADGGVPDTEVLPGLMGEKRELLRMRQCGVPSAWGVLKLSTFTFTVKGSSVNSSDRCVRMMR